MKNLQMYLGVALTALLIPGAVYAPVIRPAIRAEIDNEVSDLRESVEYIRCQIRVTMTDEQARQAQEIYERGRCERGKK